MRAHQKATRWIGLLMPLILWPAAPLQAQEPTADDYRADALSIVPLIQANYAYLDRFSGQEVPTSERLRAEAEAVHDRASLTRYAERALLALADFHAIANRNLRDSWAVAPTCSDFWMQWRDGTALVTAVRSDYPAQEAGVAIGDRLLRVDGVPLHDAVTTFWADLGLAVTDERASFAVQLFGVGRRDRPRVFTFARAGAVTLPLACGQAATPQPVTRSSDDDTLVLRFNNSLGDSRTIEAFDAAMATARPGQPVRLDLTDTPSGGNTTVARAIMGWFVDRPSFYQVHSLPREERETGIVRQWVEQVLPRTGKHHDGSLEIRVGRWTGSMGEGMAIGFDALGATVCGDPMAGLRGAIYDLRLDHSEGVIKLPVERLSAVDGTPREEFVPSPCRVP